MNRKKGPYKQNTLQNKSTIGDINEIFINACENGDYLTASRILEEIKDFNIDVTNDLGKTALRLAVENEHLEVVQVLLNKSDSQKLREALLLAIYLGHTQIAELILRHPKYKVLNEKKFVNESTDSFWQTPSSDDAQFSPDITPLILAAQYKRTEIVQMLLLSGDRIIKPHDYQCKCTECSNKFKFDSLRHSKSRLNAYRGIASESYISLASMDPIQTAFELGHELRSLAGKEKYFKTEYIQLADQLSLYAVKLLNNVRGRDELDIILNKTGKENEEKYERLARIDMALKYQEKPFVAHSNCQQKLVEIWYSGVRRISKLNQILINFLILIFMLLLPFTSLFYMVASTTRFAKFMSQPCIKFISHTTTYMVFIGLIIAETLRADVKTLDKFSIKYSPRHDAFMNYTSNTTLKYRFINTDFYIRSQNPTVLDYLCIIWILGFSWQEFKLVLQNGMREYFLSSSNTVKFIMNTFYLTSYSLKFYTMIMVAYQVNKIESDEFWKSIANLNSSDFYAQKKIYEAFYWLNADRFYWISFDPINLSEGLFSMGTLFAFGRICFLLPALEAIGPLQITLGKMISDVVKFIIIFLIIFVGFLISMTALYSYYDKDVRSSVEITDHNPSLVKAEEKFNTIRVALDTFFWAIFGLDNGKEYELDSNSSITETIGGLLYGAFHIASVIMLLNMLIAMMTKSYERIREASDVEWKFARSKLYMEYINEGSTLPTPFNIIPTPKGIFTLLHKIINFIKSKTMSTTLTLNGNIEKNDKEAYPKYSLKKQRSFRSMTNDMKRQYQNNNGHGYGDEELTYKIVMQRIIKRFLLRSQRENEKGEEGDFEQIKQDLQMVRFEMHNDLKKSRLNTLKSLSLLHDGISIMGDGLIKGSKSSLDTLKFGDFKSYDTGLNEFINDIDETEYF